MKKKNGVLWEIPWARDNEWKHYPFLTENLFEKHFPGPQPCFYILNSFLKETLETSKSNTCNETSVLSSSRRRNHKYKHKSYSESHIGSRGNFNTSLFCPFSTLETIKLHCQVANTGVKLNFFHFKVHSFSFPITSASTLNQGPGGFVTKGCWCDKASLSL